MNQWATSRPASNFCPVQRKKPIKKTDKGLFLIIEEKIKQGNYVFLPHAKQRLKERNITELDVIYLLSGKKGYERKRNKGKDIYESFSLTDK
ncbi:MAG: DUF4258 domain-containing protein, partial [Gammaproteobacteria bacterium]|nr:DUF4258 domain-containing protein [Gammaproteobacteria bacterium]